MATRPTYHYVLNDHMTTINYLSVEPRWWVESHTIVISCGLSTMLRHHTQMLFSKICGSTHPILDFEAKPLAWDNVDKANALDDYYWSISNLDSIRHCFFCCDSWSNLSKISHFSTYYDPKENFRVLETFNLIFGWGW